MLGITSQDSARFAFNPFQKQVINIGFIDRTQGLPVPECEGNFIYIEQADYPVIISFVNPATNIYQSYVARNGLMIKAPFKGIFLTHPLLNPGLGTNISPRLILITGKDNANLENDLASPFPSMPASARTIVNTAIGQSFNLFVPPGTRRIEKLEFNFAGTTVTSCVFQLLSGNSQSAGYSGLIDSAGNVYNANNLLGGYLPAVQVASGPVVFQMKGGGIMIPSYVDGLNITLVGTGLTNAGATYEATFS